MIPSIPDLAQGKKEFPPLDRPDLWVSLTARCIAHAEESLMHKKTKGLEEVVRVLVKMPDNNSKLLLAGMLNKRPKTRDCWTEPDIIGVETLQQIGEILATLRQHQYSKK